MNTRITEKIQSQLKQASVRISEIDALLLDEKVQSNSNKIKELYIERAELVPLVDNFDNWNKQQQRLDEAKTLQSDPELGELAEEEIKAASQAMADAEEELLLCLLPKNDADNKNAFVEIRAGTGGSESALFSGDLLRMYTRWAESNKLKLEPMSESPGEVGGYKEVIVKFVGKNAFALFKHEAGAHRVQRVPDTESQGRIHTSVCTVAVMPEVELADVDINQSDLRYDTYRSSGAGGQHVNTTDSAVRITHIPTGIVAECQAERSQHRNREIALSVLVARINDKHQREHQQEQESARRKMVGSGERNEKIRTYNFPQARVTDHRINLTIVQLKEILEGDLKEFYEALSQAERAEQLAQVAESIQQ